MTAGLFPTRQITRVLVTHDWDVDAGALVATSVVIVRDCGHAACWAGALSQMPKKGDLDTCLSCPTNDDLELVDVSGGCGNYALLRREAGKGG